ncbi:hypothetical protein NP493_108g04017 [Ridgeia piscesae]|uniref:Endonuclease/exonuclease/phosphatase domain-containing protein n=1 Tax=Ridgeia piscesae TaxID=27915 RepID=A0AAD9UHB1_RIDPI|nr:hypothetical protein NP493_108g04017 [Ridgeia piscesae]
MRGANCWTEHQMLRSKGDFSGRNDKHEQGVGFLIHKNTVNCVMGCRPISSRLITIRLRATPFNITITQAYAPTSDYDDDDVEDFYEQLQEVLDQTPKKDILVVQGDWNAKIGEYAYGNWITFDLEKLKDPEVAEAFHAMIGGKFAALTILDADGTDMDTLINTFNTAVTNTASEILGKHRPVKKPWVTADLLDLCDKRRELKKKKKDAEGVRQYRAANQEIKKGMKKAKLNWMEGQCQDIEDSMKKNNSKTTYQLVKDLTSTKQGRTTTIQDKDGKCLTEEQDILNRWSEYSSELYNYRAIGDPEVLNVPPATDNDNYPILREEVEAAVKSLKKGSQHERTTSRRSWCRQGGSHD